MLVICTYSSVAISVWLCGVGTFACEYSLIMVGYDLCFILIICFNGTIWYPQPVDRVPSWINLKRIFGFLIALVLNNVLFINYPGTQQWPDIRPVMVFVASPVLLGTCKQIVYIQLFLLLLP